MKESMNTPSARLLVGEMPLEDDVVDDVARVRRMAELEMTELIVDGEHL